MTDFETRLRRDLARAAELAPRFRRPTAGDGVPAGESSGRRRAPRRVALLAAAAVTVVGGATAPLWLLEDRSTDGETSCPAVLELGGARYVGQRELLRIPRPGPDLGQASVLGCADVDDRSARVTALPGVAPTLAVVADQQVWVAEGRPVPDEVLILFEPVDCAGAGEHEVVGDWVAVGGPAPAQDGLIQPPYVAEIQADRGDPLPLAEWSSVRIEVRVTEQTAGARDPGLVERALQGDTPVRIDVSCDGADFVASRIVASGA